MQSNLPYTQKDVQTCLSYIHKNLSSCCFFQIDGSYEIAFQALFQDFYLTELYRGKWGAEYISVSTQKGLEEFVKVWKHYVNSTNFGGTDFVFLDVKWKKIVEEYLLPSIKMLEADFLKNKITTVLFDHILSWTPIEELYKPTLRPSEKYILARVDIFCSLLLKNKIFKKPIWVSKYK